MKYTYCKEETKNPKFCSSHVELCHIKAVSSFPPETLLKTVNSKMNVIQLCRNCHWELDNKYFKVKINNEGFPEFED